MTSMLCFTQDDPDLASAWQLTWPQPWVCHQPDSEGQAWAEERLR